MNLLETTALLLAGMPCAIFLANLIAYRRIACDSLTRDRISVLIPARNESANIRTTLEAVLANNGCEFEVIVLDDHSTDGTAQIVRELAQRDVRVRLEEAPPLPPGWCGKQHACATLAKLARFPILVFIDADVRLANDALRRAGAFLEQRGVALASGVPRQELGTFLERLLIPLIHFILLCFLPIALMRRTRWAPLSAGCGQFFVIRKDAYSKTGGHARIRNSLHDGIQLPRLFRKEGFSTDLFDSTDFATCRMYRNGGETWRGLAKNATEALAAPGAIVPMTLLLFGGQVLPFLLLAGGSVSGGVACVFALLPRLIAAWRFQQPFGAALFHPISIFALLLIQWSAFLRHLLGKPAEWKGRTYPAIHQLKST